MNGNSVVQIGELYTAYLMDLEVAGFTGEEAEHTAAQMARLWFGLMLLHGAGNPLTSMMVGIVVMILTTQS